MKAQAVQFFLHIHFGQDGGECLPGDGRIHFRAQGGEALMQLRCRLLLQTRQVGVHMRQLPVNVVQPLPQHAGNRRAFPLAHAKEIAERLLEKVHHHIIQRVFAVAFAHQHAGQRQHVAPGRLTEGIATVGGGECL